MVSSQINKTAIEPFNYMGIPSVVALATVRALVVHQAIKHERDRLQDILNTLGRDSEEFDLTLIHEAAMLAGATECWTGTINVGIMDVNFKVPGSDEVRRQWIRFRSPIHTSGINFVRYKE